MLSARKHGMDLVVPKEKVPEDMKSLTVKPWEMKNKFGKHKPYSNSFIPGHVDHTNLDEMDSKIFYMRYLSRNKPVYI